MNVAIMGFGVVGSGVAEVIANNADHIKEHSRVDLRLSHILDIRDFPDSPFAAYMTKDVNDILADADTRIVVETMGGVEPAFSFVSACLKKGKHVVSSNKELVAKKGDVLLQLARENNVNFLFEAAVGGGIPIIRPLSICLAANRVQQIAGILNGTTNFILSKMITDNMDFAAALRLAQEKGYAEKDPTADVEGIDACRKICILASLASGKHVFPDGILTEGISALTADDVKYAAAYGCVIKLIARAKRLDDGRWCLTVSPALVPQSHMLAEVTGVFNACLVHGDMVGDVLMYGQGAGKLATASAVVADVIDCALHDDKPKTFGWGEADPNMLADPMTVDAQLFVRAKTADKAADLAKVRAALPGCTLIDSAPDDLVFVTPQQTEGTLRDAIAALRLAAPSVIRVF